MDSRPDTHSWLRVLFDRSQEAMLLVDDAGRIVDANPAAAELLDFEQPELLSTTLRDLGRSLNAEFTDGQWQWFMKAGRTVGEYSLRRGDGHVVEVEHRSVANFVPGLHLLVLQDITERKRGERLRKATNDLLALLPKTASRRAYLDSVIELLAEWTGCRCIGIRILKPCGQIPYESYVGFSQAFWEAENWLSIRTDQCVCIRAIKGTPEPQELPAMTKYGSFAPKNLQSFVGGLCEDHLGRYRGRCVVEGFVSMALIPIRHREQILGVIHLADEREGQLPRETVGLIEELALVIGEAVHRLNLEEQLQRNHDTQAAISGLLRVAQESASLGELLQRGLNLILSIPWLAVRQKGAIFLGDERQTALKLMAQSGLDEGEVCLCGTVHWGQCLCGLAASSGEIQFATVMDERHVLRTEDMEDHGHYVVPIKDADQVLGVLVLHLTAGHRRDEWEEGFLVSVARVLAGAIRRKRAEVALLETLEEVNQSRTQLQRLSRRLVEIQENERRAIARELHDEAGQLLTSLMVGLGLLEHDHDDVERAAQRIQELKRTTNEVMEGLHQLAVDLRPASLDRIGLVPALHQYLDTIRRRSQLAADLVALGDLDKRLAPDVETTLYRVVQEAVTNTLRHANATEVGVVLERRDGKVIAIVEDNGAGFNVDEAEARGRLGLLGMRERVEVLGGCLTIESEPGNGTTVFVEIPQNAPRSA